MGDWRDGGFIDPRGHVRQYRFNGLGTWTRLEDAGGGVQVRKLDPATNLILVETDPAGNPQRRAYDERGNLASVRDALDHVPPPRTPAFQAIRDGRTPA